MKISKITLGTVQLGLNYGIANADGKPDYKTSLDMLNFSWKNGINAFDTAPSYGNSEEIIGTFILTKSETEINNVVLISKLSKIDLNDKISFESLYNHIKQQINQSLINLNIKKIPIYLIHDASDIFLENGVSGLSITSPITFPNRLFFKFLYVFLSIIG